MNDSSHDDIPFDGQFQSPALRQGQPLAFIYDGRHSSIDLLTHDAQNCEYLLDASDGAWHRCRPVMPTGQTGPMQQAASRMWRAVQEVDASIHDFAGEASYSAARHNFIEAGPHPDDFCDDPDEAAKCQLTRQKSIIRVASFLQDRHGDRLPTEKGMHHHHK